VTTSRLKLWFDAHAAEARAEDPRAERIDWLRVTPFLALHLACLGLVVVGWSPFAVGVAIALYLVRMFAITAFYHRFFSHRAFRASRGWQLAFAVLGASGVQRGPLWWAAHHRSHHRESDGPLDPHSPRRKGFWTSHVGWLLTRANFRTRLELVPDLARYRELVFLDRFDALVPALLGAGLFALGAVLERVAPGLGTNGPQLFVWGFCLSTVALYHATFTINSLAHGFGTRRYETPDDSRNNPWLALLTLGEGWHNNHHRFPGAVRQGHRAWELDPTWWALVALEKLGVVHALRPLPAAARAGRRR
jgi:stearoyl-CoA desaturase (delta-9 desaturase)